MTPAFADRLRASLQEKRRLLVDWIARTPGYTRSQLLGGDRESAFQEHLRVIDQALEQSDTEPFQECSICREPMEDELLVMDYTSTVCLSHFSEQEARSLETELELSASVQRALLPHRPPSIPHIDISAYSRPAQIIGGDFFDFLEFRDGSHGLVVADVAGHGVSASLIMASLQTALRTFTPLSNSPAQVVNRLNRFFLHNINFSTFVTLFLGRVEPGTQTFLYSNAGHNPPLLYHPALSGPEALTWLRPTGPAVGLVEGHTIGEHSVSLESGSQLLLYTDGLTEAKNRDREMFGQETLEQLVAANEASTARELIDSVRHSLAAFTGDVPLDDDVTILALRVL